MQNEGYPLILFLITLLLLNVKILSPYSLYSEVRFRSLCALKPLNWRKLNEERAL